MESKWQRIQFMPLLPMGRGGRRLTGSAEHIAVSHEAALEGMVLLKNEGHCLPFSRHQRVAVFGKAQADYVKGGGGSGDVTVESVRSLLDGLEAKQKEGKVEICRALSDFYRANVEEQYANGAHPGQTVEPELPDELLAEGRDFAEVAVLCICRFSGEGWDRTGEPYDGDFFLSREEERLMRRVTEAFPRTVVVLNIGGMMDTSWFVHNDRVAAALLMGQTGMAGGLAAAELLCGDACPSGHLTDTFADAFDAYPSSEGFNDSDTWVEYQDDLYVGYRYFSTVPGAAERVCYPFGFGLSYTAFSVELAEKRYERGEGFAFTVRVTNTGDVAGREVVQLYGGLVEERPTRPARVLVAFAKTDVLEPGQTVRLELRVPLKHLGVYDEGLSAWVLQTGEYEFYLGENVRDARPIGWKKHLDGAVLELCQRRCVPTQLSRRMRADGTYETLDVRPTERPEFDEAALPFDGQCPIEHTWERTDCAWHKPETPQLLDVAEGKITLDELVAQLTLEQKVHLLGGQPNRGVANTFGLGNLPLHGIPNVMTADGPAGLRIRPECGVTTTAFPCANYLACTWNEDLVRRVGETAAMELRENGLGVWLAPAINIHRSPLCGRNFEYYSEDPLLTGRMAAAMVQGIQSQGVAASLKHFACNNKETNRRESDSRVSERALREIYLRGFEICVKEAQPWTVMSSYNIINGVRASQNADLLTGILREEWGFEGVVITDWYTHGKQYLEIAAGNDVKMGCGMPEHTIQMVREGKLSEACVDTSVKRLLRVLLKLA